MKKTYYFLSFLLITVIIGLQTQKSYAQGVAINPTGAAADTSSILDVSSTTQGMLIPRMTTVQRNAIILPAEGLQIFNITAKSLQIYVNGLWQNIWTSCNPLTAGASISVSPTGTTCLGTLKTFSISTTNIQSPYSYQWKLNGSNVGTDIGMYSTSTLVDGDVISCLVNSPTYQCVVGLPATTSFTNVIYPLPTPAYAGADVILPCGTTSTTLAGNTPTIGTGTWTKISGTATITSPTSPTSTVTGIIITSAGVTTPVKLLWTNTNAG